MRKLLLRRRAVSTMIGGLIVLVLFLMSLVAMIALSQQYDLYQVEAAKVQQMDANRFSENLQPVYPGIWPLAAQAPNCGGNSCNGYNLTLDNLGIGVQISRIYINSTQSPGCTTLCIIDPNPTANPAPFTFQASQSYVNPGEFRHGVIFWLPSVDPISGKYALLMFCTSGGKTTKYNCHTITIVTTRGRSFSFQWPFPPPGEYAGGGAGGTGIYIGPVIYTFQRPLIAYSPPVPPQIPIGGTPNGYWIVPSGTLIIYVKLETDVGTKHDAYLTPNSVLQLEMYTSPGESPSVGIVVAPPTVTLCNQIKNADPMGNSDIICDPTYGYDDSPGETKGNTGSVTDPYPKLYQSCTPVGGPANYNSANCEALGKGKRYRIPAPTVEQQKAKLRGNPVIVAFAFTTGNGINPNWAGTQTTPSDSVLTWLGLTYVWDDGKGTGAYVYGVTLPFVALCIKNEKNPALTCSG